MSKKIFNNSDKLPYTLNKLSKNNKMEYFIDSCKKKYLEKLSEIVPCSEECLYELMRSEINFRDSNSFVTEDSTSSLNEQRSKLIKNNNNNIRIDDILKTKIKCPNLYKSSEEQEKYDKIRMCGIVISTVMMLAEHSYKNITPEHVKCTKMYFQRLKENNNHPHNISMILQILKNLQNSRVIDNADETETNNIEANEEDVYINDLIN